ncbi:unnamed protein product [Scytosiphon promiscuus]
MPPSASMEKLINSLLASADSEAFREPVDWRSLGLHDYPTIIKRPMDLGTVKLRLERGAYETADACAADVRLIWENCRTYNSGGEPRKLHKASSRVRSGQSSHKDGRTRSGCLFLCLGTCLHWPRGRGSGVAAATINPSV